VNLPNPTDIPLEQTGIRALMAGLRVVRGRRLSDLSGPEKRVLQLLARRALAGHRKFRVPNRPDAGFGLAGDATNTLVREGGGSMAVLHGLEPPAKGSSLFGIMVDPQDDLRGASRASRHLLGPEPGRLAMNGIEAFNKNVGELRPRLRLGTFEHELGHGVAMSGLLRPRVYRQFVAEYEAFSPRAKRHIMRTVRRTFRRGAGRSIVDAAHKTKPDEVFAWLIKRAIEGRSTGGFFPKTQKMLRPIGRMLKRAIHDKRLRAYAGSLLRRPLREAVTVAESIA